ncbi:MAG: DnaJ domain-containing protein [Caldilineaceae bacterium]
MDLYQILDLPLTASVAEIKERYHCLCHAFHPDKFARNEEFQTYAGERLKQINNAYEILADPQKRKRYDQGYANKQHKTQSGAQGSDSSQWKARYEILVRRSQQLERDLNTANAEINRLKLSQSALINQKVREVEARLSNLQNKNKLVEYELNARMLELTDIRQQLARNNQQRTILISAIGIFLLVGLFIIFSEPLCNVFC